MRNYQRTYTRPLIPLFFTEVERQRLDMALTEVRIEADDSEDAPVLDGQAIEWLCADWLARWGL